MSVENRVQELMSTFLSTTGLPKFERRHPVAPAGASRRKEMRRADAATGFWSLLWWLSSRPVVLKSSFRGCGRETIFCLKLTARRGNCGLDGLEHGRSRAVTFRRGLRSTAAVAGRFRHASESYRMGKTDNLELNRRVLVTGRGRVDDE